MIEKLTKRRPRSVVFSSTITLSRSPLRHFPTSELSVINHTSCIIYLRRQNHSMVLLFTNNQLNSHRCAKGGRRYRTWSRDTVQFHQDGFTEPPESPSLQDRVADLLWKLIVYISAYGLDILMMIMLSKFLWCAKREAKRICASEGINHALMPCWCLLRIYQALYG